VTATARGRRRLQSARAVRAAFGQARRGLAQRRRRTLLSALGIALAAAMLAAAIVVADGLGLGFNRAARAADLADLIVRFNPQSKSKVVARIRALPDVAAYATRFELTNTPISGPDGLRRHDAIAEVLNPSRRRGYAVVAGQAIHGNGNEMLMEKAFANAYDIHVGSTVYLRGLGPERVVGLAEAPDDVGYPLGKPRYYLSYAQINRRFGVERNPQVNFAEVWLQNPRYLGEVLAQARATSFGLSNLQFATRSGVRVLLDQAAGIVIDLLVALSIIALITAGVMLAASARAEVQRRLGAIGIRRAVGATRGQVVLAQSIEAALVAIPAASVGAVIGTVATLGATDRLLTLLNEPGPGFALALPLLAGWAAAVALPTLGAAWPAFTAASASVVSLLRGAGVSVSARGRRRGGARRRGGGLISLGMRLAGARRARLVATVAMLALSAAFVLLVIALVGELSAIETDPTALGKRYQLTAVLPPAAVGRVRRIPGVLAASPRYEVTAVDSFRLGETIDVIAYPRDHTEFEAPALTAGRRLNGQDEAEVGEGLSNALGLSPGGLLGLALPGGAELRLRVSGVVSSLDHDGLVAYVPAGALVRDDPSAPSLIAVRLTPQANPNTVFAALKRLGAEPAQASGATARGVPLVDVLRTILEAVAIVDGLVCLYALIQACTLTVQERRRSIAVLRAGGGGAAAIRRLLSGAVILLVAPAAVIGVVLERFVLGPLLSHLAVNYATLSLIPSPLQVLGLVAGLAAAAAAAVVWVAGQASREPVVAGLAG
jgi:ABC-type antimicrobial peptide transport system permease subunit